MMDLTTSLGLMQICCYERNIEIPDSLASLNTEQLLMRESINEAYVQILGERDWYFLERVGMLRAVADASGTSVTTSGIAPSAVSLAIATDNPFESGTTNGKMTIVTGERDDDVIRVDAISEDDATVAAWWRDAHASADAWVYMQDEYKLASDVERVKWVVRFQGNAGLEYKRLWPISHETMEKNRSLRTNYLLADDPIHYTVMRHERLAAGTQGSMDRFLVVDPFPTEANVFWYGYIKEADNLDTETDTDLDIPVEFAPIIAAQAQVSFLGTYGLGAHANSTLSAQKSNQSLIQELMQDVVDIKGLMVRRDEKTSQISSIQPDGVQRTLARDGLGRNL